MKDNISSIIINPERDIFLSKHYTQVKDEYGLPSIHYVRSYILSQKDLNQTNIYYHLFKPINGKKIINYTKQEYLQLNKYMDLSNTWYIFTVDEKGNFYFVNNLYREQ